MGQALGRYLADQAGCALYLSCLACRAGHPLSRCLAHQPGCALYLAQAWPAGR